MKNSKILMAVFAVMLSAAAFAVAGEINVDFDGANHQPASFAEMKMAMPDFKAALPIPVESVDSAKDNVVFYKLGKARREELSNAISLKRLPELGEDIQILISNDKADILYNNKTVFFVSATEENGYNTLTESRDPRLVSFLSGTSNTGMRAVRKSPVCQLVEMTLWALVQGVWTQVIKQVEQCYTPSDPAPDGSSGSTYHNNQGGDSSYDVNKHLKL